MWSDLPFLTVYLHATGLAWDEIIPITLIGLTIVAGLVLFLLARRFKPGDEDPETSDHG
jgi:hypothetical protein